MSLAGALKGIISQRLVARGDREGRVPAMEVLVATGRVFDKIADSTQTHELEEIIADGAEGYITRYNATRAVKRFIAMAQTLTWANVE